MNALAYLGFVDLHDVERMTLVEYSLRMEAYQLQQLQVRQNIAIQAWFNQTVQATVGKKNPRPKFKKFDQFFDRMEQELEIRNRFGDGYRPVDHKYSRKEQGRIFLERYKEFRQLKAAGRIDPNAYKLVEEADKIG